MTDGDARDLRRGPVARNLVRMTGPMVWGVLAIMSMNLADLYFAGRLGTAPVAALGFAFPVILALTSLGVGLGAGTASTVARCMGGDQVEDVAQDRELLGTPEVRATEAARQWQSAAGSARISATADARSVPRLL